MFDRPFTIHFLARLNPFDERKLPLPNGCENRFTKHREAKFLFGANSFSNSCIVTRFVSSISNISTTLLKTVENKRHYSKNRDREQTGRDIDRSDLLERIELPLITYTYDVHIKYGRKKKRKGEREKKKGKIDVSPSDLTISLHRGN